VAGAEAQPEDAEVDTDEEDTEEPKRRGVKRQLEGEEEELGETGKK